MGPRYIVITNPLGLRWKAYGAELERYWRERGAPAEVVVVPWAEVAPRDGDLDGLAAFDGPAIVRVESPGRDWEVTRQLLCAGSRAEGAPDDGWLALEYQKGRQVRPGLQFAGFRRVLQGLHRSFQKRPHLRPTACPLDIAAMFDKNATCARLARAGVPVPPTWEEAPGDAEGLLGRLERERWPTAYVKLNSGSSASAIAVVRRDEQALWATSSLVRIGADYYSSRRLARHEGDALRGVLAFLIAEGACVQQGVRMAQVDGSNFDVRVVVIHGRPAFTIFRLSHLPMTNLHLGGARGDPARCRAALPTRAWLDGLDACVEAAAQYRSAAVGVDLLFEAGCMRPFVLEVNAFGDFFPNLTDEHGRGPHRVEIEETARLLGA